MESFDVDLTLQDTYDSQLSLETAMMQLTIAEDHSELEAIGGLDAYTQEACINLGNDDSYSDNYITLEEIKSELTLEGKVTDNLKFAGREGAKLVKQGIIRGWDMSREFFDRTLVGVESLHKEIHLLQKKANELKDSSMLTDTITLRREALVLSLAYSMPSSANDINKALSALESDLGYILGPWSKEVTNLGDSLSKIISKHNNDYAEESLLAALEAAEKLDFDAVQNKLKMKRISSNRIGSVITYTGSSLPSNKALFSIRPDLNDGLSEAVMIKAKAVRRRKLAMMADSNRVQDMSPTIDINTLTVSDISDILDSCIKVLKILETYDKSGQASKNEKNGREMQKRIDKSFITVSTNGKHNNAVHHFTSSFLKWSNAPSSSMITQSIATIRAATMVCKRSLSQYK